jgi:hypothetical protein
MEIKHTITKLEDELISILIETFKNHGWTIDELPTILDSDEKSNVHLNNDNYWDFDNFLGVYRQVNNLWSNEGEVVLFTEKIYDVAQAFYDHDNPPIRNPETGEVIRRENGEITRKSDLMHYLVEGQNPDYGTSLNDSINYLTAIVLIHELTHWMIHWGTDFNQKSLKCQFKYNNIDQKQFHEGLAQYFTDYVVTIYGNQKIKELFIFLKEKQSPPYQVFKELKTDLKENPIDLSSVFTAIAMCWFDGFSQSFEELKNYNNSICEVFNYEYFVHFLNSIKENKKPQKQEELSDLFKRLDRHLFFVIYFNDEFIEKNKLKITSKKYGL